jgi:hypothetical protein
MMPTMIAACATGLVLVFQDNFHAPSDGNGGEERGELQEEAAKAPAQEGGIQGQYQWWKLQQQHFHGLWWGLKKSAGEEVSIGLLTTVLLLY